MQYPPQEQPPFRQPYAPSEIYMPEQPQTYAPQQQIYAPQSQPPVQSQDIMIYFKRGYAIFCAAICTVAVLFIIGLLIFAFTTNGPIQTSDIAPIITTIIVAFAGSGLLGWLGWRMGFQQLFYRKPMLAINREGVTVNKMPLLRSGFFISWTDINSIYTSTIGYKYLCIRPKNIEQFLSRFKGRVRSPQRYNSGIFAPIMVPQVFLDKPVEEILQELYHRYANELHYYQVQLRP